MESSSGTSKLGSVSESMGSSSSSSASYFDNCPTGVTVTISGIANTDPVTTCDACPGYNQTVNLVAESNCSTTPGFDCCYCYSESEFCDVYDWPCDHIDQFYLSYAIGEDGSIFISCFVNAGCIIMPFLWNDLIHFQGTFAGIGKIEKGRTYTLYPVVDNPHCCDYSGATMEVSFS